MIYDSIENITTYRNLSEDIYVGLRFLEECSADIQIGEYVLNPNVKAIVSEYNTQHENAKGFESHREYLDIQYNLIGREIISYYPVERLIESIPYQENSDIIFYSSEVPNKNDLLVGERYFAIFFPQDGHMPKISISESEYVKKVVIKIKL